MLFAMKKIMSLSGYYAIQMMDSKKKSRDSESFLGKLRAVTNTRSRYVLYDSGESWDSG